MCNDAPIPIKFVKDLTFSSLDSATSWQVCPNEPLKTQKCMQETYKERERERDEKCQPQIGNAFMDNYY